MMCAFRKELGFCLALVIVAGLGCTTGPLSTSVRLTYPPTKTQDVVDDYHGTKVADPYRWLEEIESPAVREWIDAQNKVSRAYLARLPRRNEIKQRLTRLWDYERFGVPVNRGGRYFFLYNNGLQNQSSLCVADSLTAAPRVLLDPNKMFADATVALAGWEASEDGKLLVYGTASGGSDWIEFSVCRVDTGEKLPDHIKWVKFSGASWTKDAQGFYYSRYDEPAGGQELKGVNYFQKLYYHRLGTPQLEDRLVYHRPDQKEWGFSGSVTDDGRYLIITVMQGTETKNRVYYLDLQANGGEVVRLLDGFDAQYRFIDNEGPVFWFFTDLDAPRGRIIAVDIRQPDRRNWRELIPQAAQTLQDVAVVGDAFVTVYLQDAHSQVRLFDLKGRFTRDLALPGMGTAGGLSGRRSSPELFYSFGEFTTPTTIYRHDVRDSRNEVFRAPQVDFKPADYCSKQVFVTSKDGTRVPMFIVHRKGLKLDGLNPTLLTGYGGFDISLTPYFSPANLVWMELGGVFALVNLRGGGEYGREWHDAGRLKNKQNCFDDCIAASQWLIDGRYTSPKKLAVAGGSNGGLLVGAVITQRPDLFGAALPAVGVMDMLRFHRFTIGWGWVSDYGSADDPEMFKVLYAYSPLHNIRPGTQYPATLITTGDHDDRVVPCHSFKFAAALQAAAAGPNPILLRVETRAGHGAGKPTDKIINETADRWAFLLAALGR
ncbi:MAG TPA: prolyl oligopeptidase family serine peptidase [Phycisphaerae bacterium]|nr:prolyl oligopeptidase family serine peptidase [Phycisphaerae bacterium]HRY70109.1 prolyl oligopeptidase family serine peptidase [Phycisphaerae bacterium]HSA28248.1 prolyl oligopeptidase family serine peptidase [Phycisphaerae bacterium]